MIFVIDFDGTLASTDTVDELLERHALPRWKELEEDWLAGRITAQDCMREQIALVRADRVTLEKFFHDIQLDPSFGAFLAHVAPFARVVVVSDGLDHAIRVALAAAGFGTLPVNANALEFIAPDRLALRFPHRVATCAGGNGVCKCAVAAREAGIHGGPVVLVGDGKSDHCLAGRADVVFAKGSLVRHCQAHAIEHIPFDDFSQVLEAVRRWPQPLHRFTA